MEKLLQQNFNVLPSEIKALNPDIVIFLTGPDCDDRLSTTFTTNGPVQFEKIDGFGERQLVRIIHLDLPRHSYRTYHPGYSVRYPDEVFNPIVEKLAWMM